MPARSAIRLIAIDLDGTMLTSAREIHPENRAAVARAKAAGITIVLASGRIRPSMLRYAKDLDCLGPMVCGNGAHVLGADQQELNHVALPSYVARLIWDYAEARRLHINLYSRSDLYYREFTRWSDMYHQRLGIELGTVEPKEVALARDVTKMLIVDEPARIAGHREALAAILPLADVHITESEPEYLEFLAPNTSKASGLKHVADSLGLGAHQVAAIGDYLNDLEMVQWAGYSGAMANGAEALRQAADLVVPSNDEAGVARFIDSIVVNQRQ